jgi:uncharacterized damage-inducible protein DinB
MRTLTRTLLICLLTIATVALAQDSQPKAAADSPTKAAVTAAPENPLSAYNKKVYAGVKDILLRSAEKMPEENFGFKPTEAVRSYGQILGHTADAQYLFCSVVLGEKNPAPKIEQTKTTKPDLIVALKESFAYCDRAYDGMTDASAVQMVKFFGGDVPKLGVLGVNNLHTVEHYGNLVTYMRLKNIVPPSSEPKPGSQTQPKT